MKRGARHFRKHGFVSQEVLFFPFDGHEGIIALHVPTNRLAVCLQHKNAHRNRCEALAKLNRNISSFERMP